MAGGPMNRAWITAVVLAAASPAFADMKPSVISAFKGQRVVSKDELPEGKNDSDTIKKIRAAQLHELAGEPRGEVTGWTLHYTAFLKATGANALKMEFLNGKQLAADKRLDSVDTKTSVLTGDITIDEDEGLAKGEPYTIELVTGKGAVVATATLKMN